jgi:hypothetical protein
LSENFQDACSIIHISNLRTETHSLKLNDNMKHSKGTSKAVKQATKHLNNEDVSVEEILQDARDVMEIEASDVQSAANVLTSVEPPYKAGDTIEVKDSKRLRKGKWLIESITANAKGWEAAGRPYLKSGAVANYTAKITHQDVTEISEAPVVETKAAVPEAQEAEAVS